MVTENKNFLSNLSFRFELDKNKYPNVQYFCTAANVPGITITPVETAYKGLVFPFGPDSLQYDDLVIQFNVTENLENYIEIYNWILKIVKEEKPFECDAVLHILSSHNNVVKQIKFYDVFPINLASLSFDAQATGKEYQTAEVTFKYTKYEII